MFQQGEGSTPRISFNGNLDGFIANDRTNSFVDCDIPYCVNNNGIYLPNSHFPSQVMASSDDCSLLTTPISFPSDNVNDPLRLQSNSATCSQPDCSDTPGDFAVPSSLSGSTNSTLDNNGLENNILIAPYPTTDELTKSTGLCFDPLEGFMCSVPTYGIRYEPRFLV